MPRELGWQGLRASEMNHLLAVLAAACCLCESRSWEGRPPRPSSVVISALQQPGQPQWTPGSSGAERLAQPRVWKTASLPCSPAEGPSVRGGSRAAGARLLRGAGGGTAWCCVTTSAVRPQIKTESQVPLLCLGGDFAVPRTAAAHCCPRWRGPCPTASSRARRQGLCQSAAGKQTEVRQRVLHTSAGQSSFCCRPGESCPGPWGVDHTAKAGPGRCAL